jgi:glycosyltransferase involved in cell wall biosynthesis
MDYWPNVDAAVWFAGEILPRVRAARPEATFYVVGMRPAAAVTRLGDEARVKVTGRVDDIRPYLQHAAVVVAPLRVARGIQSKILEGMAMARPVVTTTAAARSVRATSGLHLEEAADAAEFANKVLAVLGTARGSEMGRQARQQVIAEYNWGRNLLAYDALLEGQSSAMARAVG